MGHGLIADPPHASVPVTQDAERLRLTMAEPDPRTPHDPDTWITLFGTLPLMAQPGTAWHYNTGSLVLGVLVARVAGRPLGDVMTQRLFGPLGMRSTGFWLPADQAQRLPACYLTDPATGVLTPQTASSPDVWSRPPVFPSGAGGLVSTADDVLAFGKFMLSRGLAGPKRLLSEAAVEAMTTNHLTPEQIAGGGAFLSGQGWGYGMAVAVAPDEVSGTPGRYGWAGGSGTLWFNDPVTGRIAILLTQVTDVLFNGTLDEFGRLALTA
jgi:CubicO group peptidase (beta-lactamase class C family)